MMDVQCVVCKKGEGEVHLIRCSICFKHFCDEHAYIKSGRKFCSEGCAEFFFHIDPDD